MLILLALVLQDAGRLEFAVKEGERPVACRIHLFDAQGKTPRVAGYPAWRDHFVCDGAARLDLPAGKYRYEIERGPEYTAVSGEIQVVAGGDVRASAALSRLVDLKAEGWWSGELHVHRPLEDVPLLMRAEDLHVAPVITWWNARNLWQGKPAPAELRVRFDGNRFYEVMGGEDEREGGALLYFNLKEPLPIQGAAREHPSPVAFLRQALERGGAHVDIEKPFWWDVPVWLATGRIDTIGLANNHMCRSTMLEKEAWGKPRDAERLPAPRGNGYWTQELYYHVLNAGLRVPPSAGSASGVLPNPVGYNRVYVRFEGEPTWEKWFEGLRAGHSFVTNGPLLRVKAGGRWPGHVFSSDGALEIELAGLVQGRDRIASIQVVKNGIVEITRSAEDFARTGSLGKLSFVHSGWFLVRAIADDPKTFRFASTAPWYVEVGASKVRASRKSAQFFLDWVDERTKRVKVDDPRKLEEVLKPHLEAREFWSNRVSGANAD
jgi:hypothetical protein